MTRTQRNRVLAFVSHLFNLCERWEWRGQHTNPARGIERAPEAPRDRVLDFGELAALSAAFDTLPRPLEVRLFIATTAPLWHFGRVVALRPWLSH